MVICSLCCTRIIELRVIMDIRSAQHGTSRNVLDVGRRWPSLVTPFCNNRCCKFLLWSRWQLLLRGCTVLWLTTPSNPLICTTFSIISPFLSFMGHFSGQDNHQASGLVFAKGKRTIAMSIPPRTEVSVDIAHHPAPQISRHSPSINTSDDVHVKLDRLFPDENVEGDV
jgi:hypothetical protein